MFNKATKYAFLTDELNKQFPNLRSPAVLYNFNTTQASEDKQQKLSL